MQIKGRGMSACFWRHITQHVEKLLNSCKNYLDICFKNAQNLSNEGNQVSFLSQTFHDKVNNLAIFVSYIKERRIKTSHNETTLVTIDDVSYQER